MKKVLIILLAVLVLAAIANATYRFGFRKSIPDAPVQEQVVAILQQNDCFACHSAEPQKPFYSSFPVIGKTMDEHMKHAVRFTDLETGTKSMEEVSEVTVSMIEDAMLKNNMPIHQYKMIHWGTGFNKKEKSVLAAWIRDTRLARFSNGLACEKFAAEGIQPIPAEIPVNSDKVELGRKMYFDTRISLDGTISCASCHLLDKGGADEADERTSEGIDGQMGGVNAPTVYNSFFNVQQFWNGRAADLQEQAAGPPVNPVEMGNQTWEDIIARLSQDKELTAVFKVLYPEEGLTQFTVTDAIAEFEKTLLTPDSKFDFYLKGDENALDQEEKAGWEAFKENSCATCHTGVILGGKSFEYLGVFGDYFADRSTDIVYNSDDDGLKGFTGKEEDLHKFKVPGLRNVEITPPYFHDGSILTLEDAVKAMAKYELGKEISDAEVSSIVAFMKTLTGKNENLKI